MRLLESTEQGLPGPLVFYTNTAIVANCPRVYIYLFNYISQNQGKIKFENLWNLLEVAIAWEYYRLKFHGIESDNYAMR